MYWPTTPSNGEYVFEHCDGEWLDPDKYLAEHPNWRDCSLLPTSSRESKVTDYSGKHQEDPLEKSGIVGTFCRTYSVTEAIENFIPDIYAPSAMDGRYDYIPADSAAGVVIYDDKFAYSHHATDPACGQLMNAFDAVRIHKFGRLDDKASAGTPPSKLPSFKEMCQFAVEDDKVKLAIALERQQDALEEFSDDTDWLSRLEYEPRSKVLKNSLRNLTLILENDPNLKDIVFNQQLDGMEIKGEVPWSHPSKFWRDADDAQLISYIDKHYGAFTARNYDIAVAKVTDDRSYHPIREYIDSLPEWDEVPRVDTLLIDYLGADDNEYVRAVTRKTLCAAIARVLNPGCKFDSMLVLNGPQGVGKSTLISKLAGEWFSDSLNLSDTKDKTAAEKLQGYWILEIGELAGLRKAEVETLRSFISRQNDIYRASFGKRATPHLRQCIFFGTTNAESGYLRDTTGNRRFWPVKTPGGASKHSWQLSAYEIQQIWAEALVYVVGAIAQELGIPGKYLGAPTFAYEVGDYSVDKSGVLEGEDNPGLIADLLGLHDFKAETEEYDTPLPEAEPVPENLVIPYEAALGRRVSPYKDYDESPLYDSPGEEITSLTIELPRADFTDMALANLKGLVESKETLIKKALGVDFLPVLVSEETISFPWFGGDLEADEIKAYTHFIAALTKMAKKQKRVNATEKIAENEKYAFRCFLLRLGFIGPGYKAERKILLSKLAGSSAFRTSKAKDEEV